MRYTRAAQTAQQNLVTDLATLKKDAKSSQAQRVVASAAVGEKARLLTGGIPVAWAS